MNSFSSHLRELLKDKEFRKEYYKARFFDEIGIQIIKLRNKRNLSQSALAEKAGTTQAVVSRIENGSVTASTGTIQKLAEAMDAVVKIDIIPNEEMKYLELYYEPFLLSSSKSQLEEQNISTILPNFAFPEISPEQCRMIPLSEVFSQNIKERAFA
jgi:transcriptional regulator with XRE-family HTH domain